MAKIKFTKRPSPVLAEHRPMYKIAQALLIIETCGWGKKCSLIKLHLLNWALKTQSRMDLLHRSVTSKSLFSPIWGFDPALAIALQLAVEEGLLVIDGSSIGLTDKGSELLSDINKDKSVLESEKKALKTIGKGITEAMVSSAAKGWE